MKKTMYFLQAGVVVFALALAGCGTTGSSLSRPNMEALNTLHQRALRAFAGADYTSAILLWQNALNEAYIGGLEESAALYHYHIAVALWNVSEADGQGLTRAEKMDVRQHLDAASLLLDRLEKPMPEVKLMMAEFALAAPEAGDPDALTAELLNNPKNPVDLRLQALLIRLESSLYPGLKQRFTDPEWPIERSEDEARTVVLQSRSHALKRRYAHWKAADALGTGHVEEARSFLIRALHESKLMDHTSAVALHYFEWSEVEGLLDNDFEKVELIYLAAKAWEAEGKNAEALFALNQIHEDEAKQAGGPQARLMGEMKEKLESMDLKNVEWKDFGSPVLNELRRMSVLQEDGGTNR